MVMRQSVLIAALASLLVPASVRSVEACPLPTHELVASDDLPPNPTVFVLSEPRHGGVWTETFEARRRMKSLPIAVYMDGEPVPSRMSTVVIGDAVVGALTVDVDEGLVSILSDAVLDPTMPLDPHILEVDARRRVGRHAPKPHTRIATRLVHDEHYGGSLIERDAPAVGVAIGGEGIGIWSIETPRCVERLVTSSETLVPLGCLDLTQRLVVVARAYDGSIERITVDVALPRPSWLRASGDLAIELAAALAAALATAMGAFGFAVWPWRRRPIAIVLGR